jgi:hypothetical protein
MTQKSEVVLRKTPLFASLTEQEMHALATRVSKKHFQQGELLFGEGDSCTGLFLVATGKIRIFKLSPAGNLCCRERCQSFIPGAREVACERRFEIRFGVNRCGNGSRGSRGPARLIRGSATR